MKRHKIDRPLIASLRFLWPRLCSLRSAVNSACQVVFIVAMLVAAESCWARSVENPFRPVPEFNEQELDPGDVLARVNGFEIRRARVGEFVDRRLNGRPVSEEARKRLLQAALEHLIDRQLIAEQLKTTPHWPGPNELRLARQELENRLQGMDQTLEQYLASRHMTIEEWENEAGWRIAWPSFLDAALTDQFLRDFFERHRRQFDGTRMRVAHILWVASDESNVEQLTLHAREIRERIQSGQLSWEDAARTESDAVTSAGKGGDIGWIEFEGSMPPVFTRVAFELDPGQVSEPVVTSFGVHLIRCVEIEPGKNDFGDVREQVRNTAIDATFHEMARKGRALFKIEPGSR